MDPLEQILNKADYSSLMCDMYDGAVCTLVAGKGASLRFIFPHTAGDKEPFEKPHFPLRYKGHACDMGLGCHEKAYL